MTSFLLYLKIKSVLHSIDLKYKISITYWDIVDEPKMSRSISLPKCYKKVEELIKSLENNQIHKNIDKLNN